MSKRNNSKYLFRGSTINWAGNKSHRSLPPHTPVSFHPIKAILFAICCSYHDKYRNNRIPQVVYICKKSSLKGISTETNWFAKVEDEIGYEIKPLDFILLCEGYVLLMDAVRIITVDMGFEIPSLLVSLDDALKYTPAMTDQEIANFYKLVQPFLKKP